MRFSKRLYLIVAFALFGSDVHGAQVVFPDGGVAVTKDVEQFINGMLAERGYIEAHKRFVRFLGDTRNADFYYIGSWENGDYKRFILHPHMSGTPDLVHYGEPFVSAKLHSDPSLIAEYRRWLETAYGGKRTLPKKTQARMTRVQFQALNFVPEGATLTEFEHETFNNVYVGSQKNGSVMFFEPSVAAHAYYWTVLRNGVVVKDHGKFNGLSFSGKDTVVVNWTECGLPDPFLEPYTSVESLLGYSCGGLKNEELIR